MSGNNQVTKRRTAVCAVRKVGQGEDEGRSKALYGKCNEGLHKEHFSVHMCKIL
jgi:hypothetical protein